MSTDAQIAANRRNAQASTGPMTVEGKLRVSRNALSSGLYSSGDFVRPVDRELYAEFCAGFWTDLAPEGAVEQTLAAEILHAAWRLRRCSVIESGNEEVGEGADADAELDPLLDRTQQSVDRARAHAHRLFHRAASELRRLQTERQFRGEFLDPEFDTALLGLASYKDMAPVLLRTVRARPKPEITKQSQSGAGETASIARNSPCVCGSGIKFKRCCGKGAPAVLNHAA